MAAESLAKTAKNEYRLFIDNSSQPCLVEHESELDSYGATLFSSIRLLTSTTQFKEEGSQKSQIMQTTYPQLGYYFTSNKKY